jgi:hypothetical protein
MLLKIASVFYITVQKFVSYTLIVVVENKIYMGVVSGVSVKHWRVNGFLYLSTEIMDVN